MDRKLRLTCSPSLFSVSWRATATLRDSVCTGELLSMITSTNIRRSALDNMTYAIYGHVVIAITIGLDLASPWTADSPDVDSYFYLCQDTV